MYETVDCATEDTHLTAEVVREGEREGTIETYLNGSQVLSNGSQINK